MSTTRVASVQPVDGCIDDFQFYIPANATIPTIGFCDAIRVNTDLATVAVKPLGGSDIITNGDFATTASWTAGANWSIAGGKATGAITNADLSQASVLVVGETYTIIYTVSDRTVGGAGTVTVHAGATAGTGRTADGTYSETLACTTNTTFKFTGTGFTGSVDNVYVYRHTPPLQANVWEPIRASAVVAASAGSVWIGWIRKS